MLIAQAFCSSCRLRMNGNDLEKENSRLFNLERKSRIERVLTTVLYVDRSEKEELELLRNDELLLILHIVLTWPSAECELFL